MMVDVTKGREGHLRRVEAIGPRQGNIGRDGAGAIAHFVASKAVEQPLARAFRKRTALIFSSEVALAERRIGKQAYLLAIENLGEPGLEGAIDQVVGAPIQH
jgi:hypothetical protein